MKPYILLTLIVLAVIIPFSSRAVFMDEHIFLQIARNAQHNWLFPNDTPGMFFGMPMANFAAHTHPPVGEYYLALIYSVLGRFSEVPFRLLFSVFSIATVLAFYHLARRFTDEPFYVAALFALSPAFFVMAPTLMMDLPMLAFLLAGIALYFSYLEGHKAALAWAAVCFVLSAGTGYTALVPMGCLFLQMLAARRPRKELLAVAAAPAVLVVWQLLMTVHFGALPMVQTVQFYGAKAPLLRNIAATLSFVGAVTLFPWTALTLSKRPRKPVFAAFMVIAMAFAIAVAPPTLWMRAWYVVLAGSGLTVLAAFARAAQKIIKDGKNSGEAFLIIWVPATLLFFIVVADMINARYILLSLPALYLILLRHGTARQLMLTLIPTTILSLSIAYADFTFVNSYRNWAQEIVIPLQQQGFRFWGGAESGLRFYLEQDGIPTLSSTDLRPSGTDLIVQHDLFRYGLSADVGTMLTVLKRFTLTSSFPIRTFNKEAGAGFHDSNIGVVPFSLSLAPFDQVDIAQMNPLVTQLPQVGVPAEDVPAWSPEGPIIKQNVDRREFKVKIPANSKLEYEVVGQGHAETTADGIILHRDLPGTIVWRNMRIVPAVWPKF